MLNNTVVPTPPPDLDAQLTLSTTLPSGLSILGIALVYYTYYSVFHRLGELFLHQKILYRIVVYMATANLLLTIAGIGIAYDVENRVCNPLWVFLRETAFTSSIIWSSYYAYSLKQIIMEYDFVDMRAIEKQGIKVAVILPVVATGFVILLGYQDGLSILCYTLTEEPNPGAKYIGLFGFALPVSAAFSFAVSCYVEIIQYVRERTDNTRDFRRIFREIVLFPTAMILCSFFIVLNTILVMFFNTEIETLIFIHHIFQQSTGFLNALVYGFKYAAYKHLKRQIKSVRHTIQSICSSTQENNNEMHSVWEPNKMRQHLLDHKSNDLPL